MVLIERILAACLSLEQSSLRCQFLGVFIRIVVRVLHAADVATSLLLLLQLLLVVGWSASIARVDRDAVLSRSHSAVFISLPPTRHAIHIIVVAVVVPCLLQRLLPRRLVRLPALSFRRPGLVRLICRREGNGWIEIRWLHVFLARSSHLVI